MPDKRYTGSPCDCGDQFCVGCEDVLGPNHAYDCDGTDWKYSGKGYNRVRACACGAEDHDPEDHEPLDDFYDDPDVDHLYTPPHLYM